jgi:selenocysteine lyase/cysteine desulfurase
MNIDEVRNLFPHIKTGQIYFNHAAIGPWSNLVLKRINEYSNQRSGEAIENYKSFLNWSSSAKSKLGKLIGANPDRIAWIDNVSNGLNILAQGLKWEKGDRVIINDIEFPSNVYPFLNLREYGVEIDIVKSENGIVDFEEIEKAITPGTRLVSISAVQFLSGYRANLDAIGELCKKNKMIFCVDAIQATGVVQIDVVKSNIDFLCGGTQKWLMAAQGLSYLYITEELQNKIVQKNVGWASVENAWNLLQYDLTLKTSAERFQNGTINALGVAMFDASLDIFTELNLENSSDGSLADCELRIKENTSYFINKLMEIGIEPLLKKVNEKNRAGIVSFKNERAKEVFEELEKKKIYCAVREGMVRFSPHFYNTLEEIDLVVEELKKILQK